MSGIVAIVGRPNVGKSTLFNRLVEERKAIVDDQSGVTRDRHYGLAEWQGTRFAVVDTGGYVPDSEDVFEKAIREQVHIAMEEADVLLFLTDIDLGVMPLDREVAELLRRSQKPVILVANKADNFTDITNSYEFYELNLGEPMPISAANGAGTGELLDAIAKALPDKPVPEYPDLPKFAFVGRPNVGKSSLVNALLGREQNIVTPIAGTTRDSILTRLTSFNLDCLLVDTAGLRRKARVKENIEFYSVLRTLRAIEECDVAMLVLDATQSIDAQDLAVLHLIEKHKKGVVIVVNKWDLVEKETNTARDFERAIQERIAPFVYVPIVFTSAITKQRVLKCMETAEQVFQERKKTIPTHLLNDYMLADVAAYHPPAVRGKIIRIKYVTQVPAAIPTFLFFTSHPKLIKDSYKRYLENKLREHFGFVGVPINVFFRDKN
jgi:GTP-binding protein